MAFIDWLRNDVAHTARALLRTPGFTVIVMLSLSLGIGANTALFSVIDARYLRKLPVPNPDELVALRWTQMVRAPQLGDSVGIVQSTTMSRTTFEALAAAHETLSDLFAYTYPFSASAAIDADAETLFVQLVSGNYARGLGIVAAAGRMIDLDDDRPAAEPAIVVSERFWAERFGRDPAAIGRAVRISGLTATIVGVTPPEFHGTSSRGMGDVLVPHAFEQQIRGTTDTRAATLNVMGRMKPGSNRDQVRGSLEGIFRGIEEPLPSPDIVRVEPLRLEVLSASRGEPAYFAGGFFRFVTILAVIFGLLLVIVCLNVANMLLARAATRDYEIGVRLAMGATRLRLVQHLLTESVLLALLGGIVGVLVAYWSKDLLALVVAQDVDLRIDPRVLAFTAVVSVMTGVAVGLVPAFRSTPANLSIMVSSGRRNTVRGRSHINRSFLVTQVAISVVLMVGAGLLLRTLGNLPSTMPGFDADNLLVFRVNLPESYDNERADIVSRELLEAVQSIPGVAGATFSSAPLVSTYGDWGTILSRSEPSGERASVSVRELAIEPSFFAVMGLPIVRGRALTAGDRDGAPIAAVISENGARSLFATEDPLGQSVTMFGVSARPIPVEIVGVVPDVPVATLGEEKGGTAFLTAAQERGLGRSVSELSFEARTVGDSSAVLSAIQAAARAVNPELPLFGFTTQTSLLRDRLDAVYRIALTWTLLAALAMVLTCIGLYGLMSYSVARRTNEIGIRVALGARRLNVIRLVTSQALVLVGIGIAAGIAASLLVSATIRVFVFGVTLYDPVTIVAVIAAILSVTAIASYLPARRAASVDPTNALRCE